LKTANARKSAEEEGESRKHESTETLRIGNSSRRVTFRRMSTCVPLAMPVWISKRPLRWHSQWHTLLPLLRCLKLDADRQGASELTGQLVAEHNRMV